MTIAIDITDTQDQVMDMDIQMPIESQEAKTLLP
jgi:hypothetical protein